MSATTASSSTPITRVAALGGGLIGQSWVALFLAAGEAGRGVVLFTPGEHAFGPCYERKATSYEFQGEKLEGYSFERVAGTPDAAR